jgi:hypothetical protein
MRASDPESGATRLPALNVARPMLPEIGAVILAWERLSSAVVSAACATSTSATEMSNAAWESSTTACETVFLASRLWLRESVRSADFRVA